MSTTIDSARDDLAYMRNLVGGSERMQAFIGEIFVWAGLLYGGQCFAHFLQIRGLAPETGWPGLVIAWLPTLVFTIFLSFAIWRDRKAPPGGPAARALSAVFQAAGIANLVMVVVFAYGASKFEMPVLWFYQPAVVCLFQGVAWFVAFAILRRIWLAFVAVGWLAATVTLGIVIGDNGAFVLVLAIALVTLMALPGFLIWRGVKG